MCASAPRERQFDANLTQRRKVEPENLAMTHLIPTLQRRDEAQAFFAERQPFPFARASITVTAVANMAATVAMLLGHA